jgi:hypothetical protein
MCMKKPARCSTAQIAENKGNPGPFSSEELTAFADRDCYTFETFASESSVIRNAYYYFY